MRTSDWEREPPRHAAATDADLMRLARDVASGKDEAVQPLLEADDIVQDSLLGFLNALSSFRGESSVMHFAARIAFRHALEARKRSRAVGTWLSEYQRMSEMGGARAPLPSEAVAHDRRRAILGEMLVHLPKAQAEALLLRVV